MNVKAMGQTGLTGWKGRVAHKAAPRVAERTPLDEDTVLAIVGWLFLGLWLWQTFKFARRVIQAGRTLED